ncbi:hypothetical protein SmJEL517_g02224 [Synchytrium microbalum]|uniref:Tyrosine specific protein phosphatases domain-containing protein n=1 Tax=Synchytrium microbalum TaxID=1806994 RepID=A0A507C6W9_9FUNG|nr:uncharacterized protein SmJEL517_g02224 [Synchytrium microbalum]TPX35362.1 hypothetical protein SmJEL517_g02224 [Synchytrium microbalum]
MSTTPRSFERRAAVITTPNTPFTFVITDCPSDNDLAQYADYLLGHGIKNVVRACNASSYDGAALEKSYGIKVYDMEFEDGSVPSPAILDDFRRLVKTVASSPGENAIAVHCISGLGRAPVLVACALVDDGLDPVEVATVIRKHRRGALNKKQLQWLLDGGASKGTKGVKLKGSVMNFLGFKNKGTKA